MAHCFACDLPGQFAIDRPTGRCYCSTCFEPTVEEQLRILEREDKEYILGNTLDDLPEEDLSQEDNYGLFEAGDSDLYDDGYTPVKGYSYERDYDGWNQ